MNYCTHCYCITKDTRCASCGADNLRAVQTTDFCFITEKEDMWAKMFMEILKDNDIAATSLPEYGAGLVMRTGIQERQRIYVQYKDLEKTLALLKETFSE